MNPEKISNEEALALFERVMDFIRKSKKGFFILRKLRGVHGYCSWEEGIELDYRKELLPTIIHECLHYIEPEWPENKVMYSESRIVNVLTEEEIILLLKTFSKKI